MEDNVRLCTTDDAMTHAVREIARVTAKLGEGGGRVYLWQGLTKSCRKLTAKIRDTIHLVYGGCT